MYEQETTTHRWNRRTSFVAWSGWVHALQSVVCGTNK